MSRQTFVSGDITITIDDNSPEVLAAIENAIDRGLKACGERARRYAVEACPKDTGWLKNSINYQVEDNECYIGTNVEYAPYVEYGTGIYAEEGGRQTPWSYQDAKGNWHHTHGQKPKPYIRPAVSDHADEFLDLLAESIKNA